MQLYVHIPFCKSKCRYCDFNSFACYSETTILRYLNALNKEIRLAADKYKYAKIDTIYIGGGTPSTLSENAIKSIANTIKNSFDLSTLIEWTIECNPESITESKLKTYKEAGINRISIGVQSLNDDNLKAIGRIHTSAIALEKIRLANEFFDNVSCDLIIGLPFDDENNVREEVRTLAPLVKHISMYELIVEDGTPLKDMVQRGEITLPGDDDTQSLFEAAMDEAAKFGLERYEVSNFAKDGRISLHNFGYWTREEYIGVGAGAYSLTKTKNGCDLLENEARFADLKDINRYIENIENVAEFDDIPRVDVESLDEGAVRSETIMLGLRTKRGVKSDLLQIPHNLKNFFEMTGEYTRLTDSGIAVMNSILTEILDI